jgi:hypothetical protein
MAAVPIADFGAQMSRPAGHAPTVRGFGPASCVTW